jgi:hypothetical protein
LLAALAAEVVAAAVASLAGATLLLWVVRVADVAGAATAAVAGTASRGATRRAGMRVRRFDIGTNSSNPR